MRFFARTNFREFKKLLIKKKKKKKIKNDLFCHEMSLIGEDLSLPAGTASRIPARGQPLIIKSLASADVI